uniref:hypothetical protein n=1 Tax=Bacillaceae bacterium JMAK1 TaxID=1028381 RepID=UPI0003AC07A1|nr:hypothetical protein [Bacillaceae bacterium JMAK1]AGQ45444.1 hypothetical protein [Bacillaceae bacterium JMAK1]
MSKRFKLLPSVIAVGLSLGIFVQEADAKESLKYHSTHNSIEFELDEKQGDKVKIYEGTEELNIHSNGDKITLKDLDPDTVHNLSIVYLDDTEKILNFDYVKISTQPDIFQTLSANDESIDENELEDITMDSLYIDDEVTITWQGEIPNDETEYKILRDGKDIGVTTDSTFSDPSVEPGERYIYEISTKQEVDKEVYEERLQAAEEYGLELTDEAKEEIKHDYFSVSSVLEIPEDNFETHMEQMEARSVMNRWGIQYTTFIAEDVVSELDDTWYIPYDYHLSGDNRGFGAFEEDYRTRTSFYGDFVDNNVSADIYKPGINSRGIDVTETVEYYPSGGVHNRSTQDSYTLDFSFDTTTSASNQRWSVNHSVGIPITIFGIAPPNIDYNYTVNMNSTSNSNVSGTIVGSHDRAPNHEIALYIPESGFGELIYTAGNEGFNNLFPEPISPDRNFNVTF